MSAEWNMPPQGKACSACARAFEPGEAFDAFLYECKEGYERRDFCENCRPGDEADALGAWKTRRPIPTTKKVRRFDREAIYNFFLRLDPDDDARAQFRFALALLLWRKKVLRFERSLAEADREIWRFTVPRGGETHDVARPDLDESQIERLSAQLEVLLAGEPGELDVVADVEREESDD